MLGMGTGEVVEPGSFLSPPKALDAKGGMVCLLWL